MLIESTTTPDSEAVNLGTWTSLLKDPEAKNGYTVALFSSRLVAKVMLVSETESTVPVKIGSPVIDALTILYVVVFPSDVTSKRLDPLTPPVFPFKTEKKKKERIDKK